MTTYNTIIHGDNVLESRKKLLELVAEYKKNNLFPTYLDGTNLTLPQLESNLLRVGLFDQEFFVIENLLSRLRSKEKTSLIDYLSNNDTPHIILWEKKAQTKTGLKPFSSNWKIQEFKETKTIFTFSDSLSPANQERMLPLFHKALSENDIYLVLGMIVRRVTDLLIAKDDPQALIGAPWTTKQIISQSTRWSTEQLRSFHTRLLEIDQNQKTGNTKLDLVSQLDLLLLEL